ncbi:MAG: PfkB family carbohydrate kinase [Nitrospirota bacterium]|nr:PfkB family carbohydrate kinase [Nitrospirota bacterium]
MSLLVVGSVAFDTVTTPFGHADEVLGGSATYFSVAASYFTPVSLVAVVGEDFPAKHIEFLKSRNISTEGLETVSGKTFRWKGEYGFDLNQAKTLETHLNVFQNFHPRLPESYKEAEVVFLANIDPELQLDVLKQVKSPALVVCDTMNYWIEGKYDALVHTLKSVDIMVINDGEARELAKEANLVKAAQKILSFGPRSVVIKRGEYGVIAFGRDGAFAAPAYPLESVYDPTGAGDTFAGGFLGYLVSTRNFSDASIRKAIIMGSVMASFNVEAFSLNRLKSLEYSEIEGRFMEFRRLTHFEDLS